MHVDWLTIIAQAVNFAVLVVLMKRFLYKPVLHAISEREKLVASKIAEAEEKRTDARKERSEFKEKNEAFDKERAGLMSTATKEAQSLHQKLLDEARKAAEAFSTRRQETLKKEERNLRKSVQNRIRQEVFAVARKVLKDLADADLEERLAGVFVRKLAELKEPEFPRILQATSLSSPALLRSAFDLPAAQRNALQDALNKKCSTKIFLRFETVPDLIGGIELSANGHKTAWSIADYLVSMGDNAESLLEDRPEEKPEKTAPETPRP